MKSCVLCCGYRQWLSTDWGSTNEVRFHEVRFQIDTKTNLSCENGVLRMEQQQQMQMCVPFICIRTAIGAGMPVKTLIICRCKHIIDLRLSTFVFFFFLHIIPLFCFGAGSGARVALVYRLSTSLSYVFRSRYLILAISLSRSSRARSATKKKKKIGDGQRAHAEGWTVVGSSNQSCWSHTSNIHRHTRIKILMMSIFSNGFITHDEEEYREKRKEEDGSRRRS